jgi:hypothetical protein
MTIAMSISFPRFRAFPAASAFRQTDPPTVTTMQENVPAHVVDWQRIDYGWTLPGADGCTPVRVFAVHTNGTSESGLAKHRIL